MGYRTLIVALFSIFILSSCATMNGTTPAQKRQSVQNMKNEVLTELFNLKPDTRHQVSGAPGYAVFSNVNVNIIFASFGGGYGMAKNNNTGKVTYMKMGEIGVGLGAGLKDFRAVFVFHTDNAYNRFIEHGWAFGGQADAAAKASDKGAAVAGEAIIDNVTIYQLTQSGLALQATLKGTKYWKDSELN
ncbi:YSC84-related protein [Aliikangiella sp. G2MR2-5]|uniref:lipid-binding SYLF domain-containing protein n=1 Tax=Aliikangiella sp. G2MR2-5 TaxID=2788943 RepID=UPI0018AB1D84|nr:YSC84-related protein [Aliikangiella sp. G2MR2-5]